MDKGMDVSADQGECFKNKHLREYLWKSGARGRQGRRFPDYRFLNISSQLRLEVSWIESLRWA